MALAGVAAGDAITLDTTARKDNKDSSFFDIVSKDRSSSNGYVREDEDIQKSDFTFYIKVSDLFTGDITLGEHSYTLTSLTYLGKNGEGYAGGSRSMTVSNGSSSVSASITSSAGQYTATFSDSLTFTADSILTVTLDSTVESEEFSVTVWDYNYGPVAMKGAGWSLDDAGNPVYKLAEGRPYTSWAYNEVALRLTATVTPTDVPSSPSIPEPATATLSLLALCGLASRRRRK